MKTVVLMALIKVTSLISPSSGQVKFSFPIASGQAIFHFKPLPERVRDRRRINNYRALKPKLRKIIPDSYRDQLDGLIILALLKKRKSSPVFKSFN